MLYFLIKLIDEVTSSGVYVGFVANELLAEKWSATYWKVGTLFLIVLLKESRES